MPATVVIMPATNRSDTLSPAAYSHGSCTRTRARLLVAPSAFRSSVRIDGVAVPNVPPIRAKSSVAGVPGNTVCIASHTRKSVSGMGNGCSSASAKMFALTKAGDSVPPNRSEPEILTSPVMFWTVAIVIFPLKVN